MVKHTPPHREGVEEEVIGDKYDVYAWLLDFAPKLHKFSSQNLAIIRKKFKGMIWILGFMFNYSGMINEMRIILKIRSSCLN